MTRFHYAFIPGRLAFINEDQLMVARYAQNNSKDKPVVGAVSAPNYDKAFQAVYRDVELSRQMVLA